MSFQAPMSRNEAILQNILGANNVLVDPQSRIEAILQAILYDEAYDEEAMSRMEELLLAIKNNGTWDHEPISRNEEILYAKLTGGTYDKEPQSRIEALLIDWLNAEPSYIEKTVTGAIVSVDDAIAAAVIELIAQIVATQNLNGQSAPYPSGGQLWDEVTEFGSWNDSLQRWQSSTVQLKSKNYIPIQPSTTYRLVNPTGTISRYVFYDAEKNYLSYASATSNAQFTTPSGAYYMMFGLASQYGTVYEYNVAINYPATDTSYHPYSNICPISGFSACNVTKCGKNIIDSAFFEQSSDYYYKSNPDGSVTVKRSDGRGWSSASLRYPVKLSAGTYTVTRTSEYGTVQIYNDAGTSLVGIPAGTTTGNFTLSTDTYIKIKLDVGASGHYPLTEHFCIEKGSPSTGYEPYTGVTVNIPFGQTVYGDSLNVTTGVLHCTWSKKTISELSFAAQSGNRFTATINDCVNTPNFTGFLCSAYKPILVNANYNTWMSNRVITIVDNRYTTAAEFKEAMGDTQIVYPLAEPFDIQLTPTEVSLLLGNNTVFADTGNVTMTYKASAEA